LVPGLGLSPIIYGNGLFMALGVPSSSFNRILTSTDGVNWGPGGPPFNPALQGSPSAISFDAGQFVVLVGGQAVSSADGTSTNWVEHPMVSLEDHNSVAYGNGVFVAVDEGIRTSTDVVNWVQHQFWTQEDLAGIAYGKGQFVAVGVNWRQPSCSLLTSTDALSWVSHPIGSMANLISIVYGNEQFVAVGWADNAQAMVLVSTDGVNWLERQPGILPLSSVTYGNGQYVAVGQTAFRGPATSVGTVSSSVDGLNWIQREPGTKQPLSGVTYGNGLFVAVGFQTILTSPDGMTWVEQLGVIDSLNGVVYGKGQFVAVGPGNTILTSPDGTNWTRRQSPVATSYYNAVAYSSGQFVAVTEGGGMVTSADGINWAPRETRTTLPFQGICGVDGRFIAVGPGGRIFDTGTIVTLALTPMPSNRLLSLSVQGPTGLDLTIQGSTDLTSWRNLTNVVTDQMTAIPLNLSTAPDGHMFYRALAK
jgi:hypothetical protein